MYQEIYEIKYVVKHLENILARESEIFQFS